MTFIGVYSGTMNYEVFHVLCGKFANETDVDNMREPRLVIEIDVDVGYLGEASLGEGFHICDLILAELQLIYLWPICLSNVTNAINPIKSCIMLSSTHRKNF